MSVLEQIGPVKTAFVFAGGGSFGAIQVGMLQSLAAHGIVADMVVGSSVGALNGAFYAGDPTLGGVERLATIWRGLQRRDVFPMSWRTVLSFLWRRDFLIPHDGIRKLIDDHIPFRNLQDARLPVHIVTTDIISGDSVVLSEGSTAEAIVASTAIPGAFAPIRHNDHYLADGAISSNTPIKVAVKKGAQRLIILPTGHACATQAPPVGAVANALHALTLLIARQLVSELESLDPAIEYFVVPPLCPLVGSPYDFSRTADHIDRAIATTDAWLAQHGLQEGKIPHEMRPHRH
ncbi:NTE family protein [Bradyrhizobium erythrophlei]|nr:NTE family protein [Bradyrhizobium erythrophlei]